MAKKSELWLRLHHYHFDHVVPAHLTDQVLAVFGNSDPSTHAFASKIARKLGWSRVFALRAIAEYKKFVFLGIANESGVTPPKVIDQVWHEHLLFSRAYRDFCREVLQREFDHNPELMPTKAQTHTYHSQFEATLARYRAEFNREPPVDIWGTPKFKSRRTADAEPSIYVYSSGDSGQDSAPLFQQFQGSGDDVGFGDGGGFAGGGAGRSWGDSDTTAAGHHDGGSDSGSDSGGDSGGDSGSCSGGSGCSSSCGGGGE